MNHGLIILCQTLILDLLLKTKLLLISICPEFGGSHIISSNLISGSSQGHIIINRHIRDLHRPKNHHHIYGLQLVHVLSQLSDCGLQVCHLMSGSLDFLTHLNLSARLLIDILRGITTPMRSLLIILGIVVSRLEVGLLEEWARCLIRCIVAWMSGGHTQLHQQQTQDEMEKQKNSESWKGKRWIHLKVQGLEQVILPLLVKSQCSKPFHPRCLLLLSLIL